MNWAGIFIGIGLVGIAAACGPVGWIVLVAVAAWVWSRG